MLTKAQANSFDAFSYFASIVKRLDWNVTPNSGIAKNARVNTMKELDFGHQMRTFASNHFNTALGFSAFLGSSFDSSWEYSSIPLKINNNSTLINKLQVLLRVHGAKFSVSTSFDWNQTKHMTFVLDKRKTYCKKFHWNIANFIAKLLHSLAINSNINSYHCKRHAHWPCAVVHAQLFKQFAIWFVQNSHKMC